MNIYNIYEELYTRNLRLYIRNLRLIPISHQLSHPGSTKQSQIGPLPQEVYNKVSQSKRCLNHLAATHSSELTAFLYVFP